MHPLRLAAAGLFLFSAATVYPQQAATPRDYRAPQTIVHGAFVTPVAGAPFTARVDILTTRKLDDGTTETRTTLNHIARDSAGRIYNERRQLVSTGFQGEPRLLSSHIYDPATRTSVFLEPATHVARQMILQHAPADSTAAEAHRPLAPNAHEDDLGTETLSGLTVHGTRRTRVLPAEAAGTSTPVTIVDEYWYSPDLSMYLLIHHTDPRTGEQTVGLSDIERTEPSPTLFTVPSTYKLVDETPVAVPLQQNLVATHP